MAYELRKEELDSNPQELDKELDKNRDAGRRWRAKQDPILYKEKLKKYREQDAATKRELKNSGAIDGLLLILGQIIAGKKGI
jgi:hypothetical protein